MPQVCPQVSGRDLTGARARSKDLSSGVVARRGVTSCHAKPSCSAIPPPAISCRTPSASRGLLAYCPSLIQIFCGGPGLGLGTSFHPPRLQRPQADRRRVERVHRSTAEQQLATVPAGRSLCARQIRRSSPTIGMSQAPANVFGSISPSRSSHPRPATNTNEPGVEVDVVDLARLVDQAERTLRPRASRTSPR